MLVELKSTWFAPSEVVQKDKIQSISGRRYKKGVHEIPDELKNLLPKSAKVLRSKPKEEEKPSDDLKDYDMDRKASDDLIKKLDVVEQTLTERRREQMAKARAAKKEKELAPKE